MILTPKIVINSYNRKSKGVRRLAKALGGRVYRPGDTVLSSALCINWGDSQCQLPRVLNPPNLVRSMSNKRLAFDAFLSAGVPIPRYAKRKEDVTWAGSTVVRHKLTGHSGEGIEICDAGQELPDAPLYVEYVKKQDEYRIHVGKKNGAVVVIAKQRKGRCKDVPDKEVNWRVRNHKNGFVFVRQDCQPPDDVLAAACHALSATSLDFGAVDVIYNKKEGKAYVLEINTAPGLEGQTVQDYANFFKS